MIIILAEAKNGVRIVFERKTWREALSLEKTLRKFNWKIIKKKEEK